MLLEVENLTVSFHSRDGVNEAVKGIFSISRKVRPSLLSARAYGRGDHGPNVAAA